MLNHLNNTTPSERAYILVGKTDNKNVSSKDKFVTRARRLTVVCQSLLSEAAILRQRFEVRLKTFTSRAQYLIWVST